MRPLAGRHEIGFIGTSPPHTGTGRYAFEIVRGLRKAGVAISAVHLDEVGSAVRSTSGASDTSVIPVRHFPLEHKYVFYARASRHIPTYAAYHIATQNLSFLPLQPKLVSCLDLIHRVAPDTWKDPVISRLLYSGLRNARHIVAISEYTKKDLVATLNIPPDRITVTPLGINHQVFHPRVQKKSLSTYGLGAGRRYILHVSSEVPRKNFDSVLRAFALLKRDPRFSDLVLVKAGSPLKHKDRGRSLDLVTSLGIEGSVLFLDRTTETDLAALYAGAAVFVFPSSYEGFGFPPLEAMACGTPVVTSAATSLPEVTGDAALTVAPHDFQAQAKAIGQLLTDSALRDELVARGLARASEFTWERTVEGTLSAYAAARLLP